MADPAGITLLTGATGYVGGRLLHSLEESGTRLRCLARRPECLAARVAVGTEVVGGDVLDRDSLSRVMEGVTTAYYLVHSMSDDGDWEEMERRLMRLPYDFDHPYWIEDEFFDIEHHMFHGRLPEPGDWRQLCIQVARIHARPLDRGRPLWEMYVIEGLDKIDGVPKGMIERAVDPVRGSALVRIWYSPAVTWSNL